MIKKVECIKHLVCACACATVVVGALAGAILSFEKCVKDSQEKTTTLYEIAQDNGYVQTLQENSQSANMSMDEYMKSESVSAEASLEYFSKKAEYERQISNDLYKGMIGLSSSVLMIVPTVICVSNAIKSGKKDEETELVL